MWNVGIAGRSKSHLCHEIQGNNVLLDTEWIVCFSVMSCQYQPGSSVGLPVQRQQTTVFSLVKRQIGDIEIMGPLLSGTVGAQDQHHHTIKDD